MSHWLQYVLLSAALVQALYHLFIFARLNFYKKTYALADQLPDISVVVCVRNEAQQIGRLLKLLLIQQYPEFEVVVVNDQSTDDTAKVLSDFAVRNPHLKVVNVPFDFKKPYGGKKYPLTLGVQNATHSFIITTDADCTPASFHWLKNMASGFYSNTNFVLGFSPIQKQGGWLNALQRFDGVMTAAQYFSYALAGMPYMGVGRNMGFRKSVFDGEKLYARSPQTASGDDDLLVNAVAQTDTTTICLAPDSFVYTSGKQSFGQWLRQKTRHSRASVLYKPHHLLLLWLFMLSKWLFYFSFLVILLCGLLTTTAIVIFGTTLLLIMLCTFRILWQFQETSLLFAFPLFDFFYVCFIALQPVMLILNREDQWK